MSSVSYPNIYADELFCLGYGKPLWMPESSAEIGDVGFFHKGSGEFIRLFNAIRGANDPLNPYGVPEEFRPLVLPHYLVRPCPAKLRNGLHNNNSVSATQIAGGLAGGTPTVSGSMEFRVASSKDRGAFLYLTEDADGLECAPNTLIKLYIAQYYDSWCKFAQALHWDLHNPELEGPVFIDGWVRSSDWKVAAWIGSHNRHEFVLRAAIGQLGAAFSFSEMNSTYSELQSRSGPRRSPSLVPGTPRRDQSVFLSYYKVNRRQLLPNEVMKCGAGYDELPRNGPDEAPSPCASVEIDKVPDIAESRYDPLSQLSDHIFERSDAQLAVVCIGDLKDIYKEEEWPTEIRQSLRSREPPLKTTTIAGNCVGMINPEVISDDPATPNVETVSESDFQRRCQLRQPDTAVSKFVPIQVVHEDTTTLLPSTSTPVVPHSIPLIPSSIETGTAGGGSTDPTSFQSYDSPLDDKSNTSLGGSSKPTSHYSMFQADPVPVTSRAPSHCLREILHRQTTVDTSKSSLRHFGMHTGGALIDIHKPPFREDVPSGSSTAPILNICAFTPIESSSPTITSPELDVSFRTPLVYINGLRPNCPEDELRDLANQFGEIVAVRTFTRHVSDKPPGYGFVLFYTVEAAERCIEKLGKEGHLHLSFVKVLATIPIVASSNIIQQRGLPKIPYANGDAKGQFQNTPLSGKVPDVEPEGFKAKMERLKDPTSTNLCMEGLPLGVTEDILAALVSPYKIMSSRLFQTGLSNLPRKIAFVQLETRSAAEEVVERLHGRIVRDRNAPGCRISVRFTYKNEQRELRGNECPSREGDQPPARLSIPLASSLPWRLFTRMPSGATFSPSPTLNENISLQDGHLPNRTSISPPRSVTGTRNFCNEPQKYCASTPVSLQLFHGLTLQSHPITSGPRKLTYNDRYYPLPPNPGISHDLHIVEEGVITLRGGLGVPQRIGSVIRAHSSQSLQEQKLIPQARLHSQNETLSMMYMSDIPRRSAWSVRNPSLFVPEDTPGNPRASFKLAGTESTISEADFHEGLTDYSGQVLSRSLDACGIGSAVKVRMPSIEVSVQNSASLGSTFDHINACLPLNLQRHKTDNSSAHSQCGIQTHMTSTTLSMRSLQPARDSTANSSDPHHRRGTIREEWKSGRKDNQNPGAIQLGRVVMGNDSCVEEAWRVPKGPQVPQVIGYRSEHTEREACQSIGLISPRARCHGGELIRMPNMEGAVQLAPTK